MDKLAIAEMLGGYMAGVTVSGVLWAIFQNNAGGAWDNAKKSFEAGVEINGEMTYKGSDAHKAAVTGDTVGDPFKDTSGPSMNILIKLTCLVGLVIAPILGGHGAEEGLAMTNNIEVTVSNDEKSVEKRVEVKMTKNEDGDTKATVVTKNIDENGDKKVKEQLLEGTEEEIKAKLDAMNETADDVKIKVKKVIEEIDEKVNK